MGKSSRDIEYTVEVRIIGSKEKPPVITMNVQLGELLASPYTREFMLERMKKYLDRFSTSIGVVDEMLEAVIRFMPLHSMRSFIPITNEEIEEICEDLKKHVESQL